MATDYQDSKKGTKFSVDEEVKLWDEESEYRKEAGWVYGRVIEIGEETMLIKWKDLIDTTEYELSNLPNILHA